MKFTKDSPGCYDQLIDYLAEIENTSTKKTLYFNSLNEAKGVVKNYDLVLEKMGVKFQEPKVELRKGGVKVLMVSSYVVNDLTKQSASEIMTGWSQRTFIDLPIDSVFDKIYATIRKGLNDFKTVPEYVGKHKICEGGGWYSWGSLYKVKDKYFGF